MSNTENKETKVKKEKVAPPEAMSMRTKASPPEKKAVGEWTDGDKSKAKGLPVEGQRANFEELIQLLEGVRILAVTGAAIIEEGIETEDLEDVLAAAKHFNKLKQAVVGLDKVWPALKEIDTLQAAQVFAKFGEIARDTKRAWNGEKGILG